MTVAKIPRIDYPKKGNLQDYMTFNKVVRKLKKLSKPIIIECFKPKERLTEEMYEDYICFLQGKIIHANREETIKASQLSGKKLAEYARDLKTSKY